jgi:hypothetical protein
MSEKQKQRISETMKEKKKPAKEIMTELLVIVGITKTPPNLHFQVPILFL